MLALLLAIETGTGMSILALFLLLAAIILFLIRTFWPGESRINLVAAGLACFAGFVLAIHFTTATVGH